MNKSLQQYKAVATAWANWQQIFFQNVVGGVVRATPVILFS
ncbi:hypothetical protein [Polluticaenibacter yanchengensis]|uniref:Uncharacterized protein n=1 Tax=Polluticaenibacter yanchengensis TaxID=3014562 RepID=A0ABT4UM86_9BACT|nr:hypothetical protein [Chitinophagaceae bacterium LY-5]